MITLYDLVGANDQRFSPYCWRIKAALAYKNLPYTTVPVRFTEKDKISLSGQERVPVIADNGTVVYDSWTIASYLEDHYPAPLLFPGPGLKEACRFFNRYVDGTLHTAVFPLVVYDIFTKIYPVDRAYFRSSREQRLGMTLEETEAKRAEHRPRVQALLSDLDALLSEQEYIFGLLTYADFCLFGTLKWMTAVSNEPFFDSTPTLRGWWERLQKRLSI